MGVGTVIYVAVKILQGYSDWYMKNGGVREMQEKKKLEAAEKLAKRKAQETIDK